MPGLESRSGGLLHDPKRAFHNQQISLAPRHLVTPRAEEASSRAVLPLSLNRTRPLCFPLFNLLTFASAVLALTVWVERVRQWTQARLEAQAPHRACEETSSLF